MPEDTANKSALEWLSEPAIVEGRVVYAYRNVGGVAADQVMESVNVFNASDSKAQSFLLGILAPEQEQETHAPVGHDLVDGVARVLVTVQSLRTGQTEYDSVLEGSVDGHAEGGVLRPGPPPEGSVNEAGPLRIDLTNPVIDGDDIVVIYRIEGGTDIEGVSCSVTLTDPSGQMRWMGSEAGDNVRDGVVRVGVPFDLVDDEGWRLEVVASVFSSDDAQSHARLEMQLAFADGVVGDGGHAVLTDG